MHDILKDPLFQALFNSPVPRIIIKADAPVFTIVTSNDAHKLATNLTGKAIDGKSVWEIFDPNGAGSNGGELLGNALRKAQTTNETVLMPPFRYDMFSSDGNGMVEKWWQLEIMPVGGNKKEPGFLLTTTNDISDQVFRERHIEEGQRKLAKMNALLEERVRERMSELSASETKFRAIVEQSPVAISLLAGKDHVVEAANREMLRVWGRDSSITGKRIIEALPEMEGQEYPAILDAVFQTGKPYYGTDAEVKLNRNGRIETAYFNFVNYPIRGEDNSIEGIIVVAHEVTEQVQARQLLEKSEFRLRSIIETAHYPLMILEGSDWVVGIANEQLANLWERPLSELVGRKLTEIIPEISEQTYPSFLAEVFKTGNGFGIDEAPFYIKRRGGDTVLKYASFHYDPLLDENNNVTAVIVSAMDITNQVNARKELERVYEQAQLSKSAAQLGTFDMDLIKGTMEWDARCRELFGINHSNEVSYENDFLPGLHVDDRDRVNNLIARLFDPLQSDGIYDVDYRTIGVEDQRVRWVRAKGKVFFDNEKRPVRFIGSVLDITDKKNEEQLRNDFIGMASHELKTPLTSLQAYIQILEKKLKESEDSFIPSALQQAKKQLMKMGTMIHGFLNLSRLESGKLHLNITDTNIQEAIREAIDEVLFINKGIDITFFSTETVYVHVDKEKVGNIIVNLLSNAIKFSGKEKPIEVACTTDHDTFTVSVRDYGPGISPADIDNIFLRFYRAVATKTQVSGFGIGLYLSYEIVKLHGGKIWVESEPGQGACFYFTLPLKQ